MIDHPAFYEAEPWAVRERPLDLSILAETESIFALSNGHLGFRGNLDEGEPHAMPGTYLNAFHELRPLPYAEPGYGNPENSQTLINVTDGKILRLFVDDAPFDVRYGRLLAHRRTLDLRAGCLHREAEWQSPAGISVRVTSTRLVSFTHRAVGAILYEVEPVDRTVRLVVQSELVANQPPPASAAESLPTVRQDPRISPTLVSPLVPEQATHRELRSTLLHTTRLSKLRMAAAMDHRVEGPTGMLTSTESSPDLGRVTVTAEVAPGERLRVTKFVAYGWSSIRSAPALRDQVEAALAGALRFGFDGLLKSQREYLDRFWDRADVEVEGDDELQLALRFALFHVLQASARTEERAIPAKGLTGIGYEGHTFWDMETFVLHALTYLAPRLVPSALRWRYSTLPLARERAKPLSPAGSAGAAFPWRTITGLEASAYWPAGIAAVHINADVADAVLRYVRATGDRDFERAYGVELLVETARFWRTLGAFDGEGRFRIDGVTGPDEYSALADNNLYTNLMAQQNLIGAAEAAERYSDRASALGVSSEEIGAWRAAARAMSIPFDTSLGIHSQAERFTSHARWLFDETQPDQYPLLLHFPYFKLYRRQVIKQADLVLALHLRGDAFSVEEKRRAFDYYEGLTVRDSSLSASTQAILAAEVGHLDLAYDYLAESALIDLEDVEQNVSDGLHIAALAGSWLATVCGLGGLRDHDGRLSFSPRLPVPLKRLTFRVTFQGRLVRVDVEPGQARYSLMEGSAIPIRHHRDEVLLGSSPVTLPIPPLTASPRPSQPRGREPTRRDPRSQKTGRSA